MAKKKQDQLLTLDDDQSSVFAQYARVIEGAILSLNTKKSDPKITLYLQQISAWLPFLESLTQRMRDPEDIKGSDDIAKLKDYASYFENTLSLWLELTVDKLLDKQVLNHLHLKLHYLVMTQMLASPLNTLKSRPAFRPDIRDVAQAILDELNEENPSLDFLDGKYLYSLDHIRMKGSGNLRPTVINLIRGDAPGEVKIPIQGSVKERLLKYFLDSSTFQDAVIQIPTPKQDSQNSEKYMWSIFIKTSSTDITKISYLLWTFSEALSKLENVEVEIEDWGKGSFWAKWKLKIAGWLAKEEVKNLLDKTFKGVQAHYLDKPILEAEKTGLENQKLSEDLKRMTDPGLLKQKEQLDLEAQQLDNELKRLEVARRKIDILERLSSFAGDGMLNIDASYVIEINETLAIRHHKSGFLEVGDIDEIDKKTKKVIDE